ncbi:methyltransferase domain-containing protein [Paenibacillus sp. YN15]|uniref:MerR family transcriptional regulator n=1 Tax=Paenibacillus sp. YN15 TaxID=1742774 RepID=UPI000DCBAAA6|nr:methyltransferase domain-containing protein [Paenibacillus sp. YN15]RAU99528.1 transcriptional regulator [Paenibacillus sp. YN15]
MDTFHITEAARRLGITTRTIRFYEEKGLLTFSKDPVNGYRLFSGHDLLRLETILVLREAGLSIPDLRNVLETHGMGRQEESLYLLELQRSLLYARRLDLDNQIRMNEELIRSFSREGMNLSPALQHQAGDVRKQRELRSSWTDHYRFDLQAEDFDAQLAEGSAQYPGYPDAIRLMAELLDPKPAESGLDIGTGTGNLAEALGKQGAVIRGVDQSRRMLQVCRRKFPMMETKLGNALAIPYDAGSFDFAASGYVFHLLAPEERSQALAELLRVLKPGGRFAICALLPAEAWSFAAAVLDGWQTHLHPLPGQKQVSVLYAAKPC